MKKETDVGKFRWPLALSKSSPLRLAAQAYYREVVFYMH